MHINNLSGTRMPVTPTADRASQTARTRFGTLVQGAGAPTAGRAAVPGSSIVSTAISANSGAAPGATFGAPYLQARSSSAAAPATGSTTPGQTQAPGASNPGSEFNAELQADYDQQQAMHELVTMSLTSFVNSIFAMGQHRPGIEAL
jgi:hypothetical protein